MYLNQDSDITIATSVKYSNWRSEEYPPFEFLNDQRGLVTFSSTDPAWVASLNSWRFLQVTIDPELLTDLATLATTLRNIQLHGGVIRAQEVVATAPAAEDLLYDNTELIEVAIFLNIILKNQIIFRPNS